MTFFLRKTKNLRSQINQARLVGLSIISIGNIVVRKVGPWGNDKTVFTVFSLQIQENKTRIKFNKTIVVEKF